MFGRPTDDERSRVRPAEADVDRAEEVPPEGPSTVPHRPEPPPPGARSGPSAASPLGDVNLTVPSRPRPRAEARPGGGQGTETVIGARSTFEGTIRAGGPLRIRGQVEGEVTGDAEVSVEPSARVRANIAGASITIQGTVEGSVSSPGRVEIAPTGRITGEIRAGTLVMQEGAKVDGTLHMGASVVQVTPEPAG